MIRPRKFRTKEARRRERIRVLFRMAVLLVGCGAILTGVIYALHVPGVRVSAFTMTTDGALQSDALATVALATLNGTYAGVIPKNFVPIVSTTHLEKVLAAAFPRIAHIEVTRSGVTSLNATVHERTPSALWCGDVVPPLSETPGQTVSGGEEGMCYLLDNEGYLYDHAPSYSGNSFVRYYGSLAQAEPIGQYMVDKQEFLEWQTFVARMSENKHTVSTVLFVDERDVELTLTPNIRVIVPRTQDKNTLYDRLHATLVSGTVDMTRPVEYLDMRFGTKVFVKYRDTTPIPPIEE